MQKVYYRPWNSTVVLPVLTLNSFLSLYRVFYMKIYQNSKEKDALWQRCFPRAFADNVFFSHERRGIDWSVVDPFTAVQQGCLVELRCTTLSDWRVILVSVNTTFYSVSTVKDSFQIFSWYNAFCDKPLILNKWFYACVNFPFKNK
jgi:hypothetical protein